ncbi:helix-turn-helix domain-containing protein [Bradyrhizobium sp.]
MPAKPPDPVDVHVGKRVRIRRIEIDMAQQVLGQHVGLTFQQIQKYEKGTNRIGASRLQQIGKALEVPAAYFFEGAPGGWEGDTSSQTPAATIELLATREGKNLVAAFARITDSKIRHSFVGLIEKVATLIDSKPPPPKRSRPKKRK